MERVARLPVVEGGGEAQRRRRFFRRQAAAAGGSGDDSMPRSTTAASLMRCSSRSIISAVRPEVVARSRCVSFSFSACTAPAIMG